MLIKTLIESLEYSKCSMLVFVGCCIDIIITGKAIMNTDFFKFLFHNQDSAGKTSPVEELFQAVLDWVTKIIALKMLSYQTTNQHKF